MKYQAQDASLVDVCIHVLCFYKRNFCTPALGWISLQPAVPQQIKSCPFMMNFGPTHGLLPTSGYVKILNTI